MIVVIAHIKGGTGKTTAATQIALARQMAHPERRVWLVDTDEQQSSLDTASIRSEQGLKPDLICAAYSSSKQLVSQLNAQAGVWDDIVIDCGGRDSDELRVALLAADKLVVPVLPRAYDIWSLARLETIMESARNYGGHFEALAFINRKDKSAECKDAVKYLQENEAFKLMTASLSDRKSYGKAGGSGRAVSELKPCDKKAVEEINALTKEIFGD